MGDVAPYRVWSPLLSLLQDHEDGVFRQRLEELLCVHAGPIFIQHQGTDTQYIQRVTDLQHKGQRGSASCGESVFTGHAGQMHTAQFRQVSLHYCTTTHIVNFYQHELETCTSFTDGAAVSESQASLLMVIVILYTHQAVSVNPHYV